LRDFATFKAGMRRFVLRRLVPIYAVEPDLGYEERIAYSGVKLQRLSAGSRNGRKYWKWVLQLPPSLVNHLNWKAGDDIIVYLEDDSIRLKNARKRTGGKGSRE